MSLSREQRYKQSALQFQGRTILTLPVLIRFLKIIDDGIPAREEKEARDHISPLVFKKKIAEMKAGHFCKDPFNRPAEQQPCRLSLSLAGALNLLDQPADNY